MIGSNGKRSGAVIQQLCFNSKEKEKKAANVAAAISFSSLFSNGHFLRPKDYGINGWASLRLARHRRGSPCFPLADFIPFPFGWNKQPLMAELSFFLFFLLKMISL